MQFQAPEDFSLRRRLINFDVVIEFFRRNPSIPRHFSIFPPIILLKGEVKGLTSITADYISSLGVGVESEISWALLLFIPKGISYDYSILRARFFFSNINNLTIFIKAISYNITINISDL